MQNNGFPFENPLIKNKIYGDEQAIMKNFNTTAKVNMKTQSPPKCIKNKAPQQSNF